MYNLQDLTHHPPMIICFLTARSTFRFPSEAFLDYLFPSIDLLSNKFPSFAQKLMSA